jgi:catalase-peroxidase
MLDSKRYHSDNKRGQGDESTLENPLAAVQMGLIYVNPEGPGGNGDPLSAARDIRETFARMAMNDEETVALIAGGHTFGKGHGAGPDDNVGPAPEDASIEQQGFGWKNAFGTGKGADTITSGLEGAWTTNPIAWDNGYFHNLFAYEWKKAETPAGATLWIPTDEKAASLVPDAHIPERTHAPVMFTTDIALRADPAYKVISERFRDDHEAFSDAFGRAWYKLCHRDMGPHARCLGDQVPPPQIWQDPVPDHKGPLVTDEQVAGLKAAILGSGLTNAQLVRTAWASASTHRVTDFRGGANGARIALSPQKDWKVNSPDELASVLEVYRGIQSSSDANIYLADLIVLGGVAAVEAAAAAGGVAVQVPFNPGRTDATQEQTDVASFAVLEPKVDGFRNYNPCPFGQVHTLVDRAHKLGLSATEMAVLIAGIRVLDANHGGSQVGVLTKTPGTLDNSFFVNLCDISTTWEASEGDANVFNGKDMNTGEVTWSASTVDLIFGSNSQLRAIAEHYAEDSEKEAFVNDFVAAWTKVMSLDRF